MPDPFSDNIDWNAAMRRQFTLRPEKFGYMGSYSREMMHAESSVDMLDYFSDMMMVRLYTSVMVGQTIREKPEVFISFPSSAWQRVKGKIADKHDRWDTLWGGHDPDTWEQTTPPPWLILLWPFIVLFPKWFRKHPVKMTKHTTTVEFEQRVLYPELDAPAIAGRPVIYETLQLPYNSPFGLDSGLGFPDQGRFMNRHEIAREILQDPDANYHAYGPSYGPDSVLTWLERHGVNVDQLVQRR